MSERERREKANAASRGCSNTCRLVPSKHNTHIICRCACSAKFIYGPKFVGVFEPSAGRIAEEQVPAEDTFMRRITIPLENAPFPRTGYSQSFRMVIDHDHDIHLHNLALTRLCATESCMCMAPLIQRL